MAGVATDSQDRVFVFNRSEHPVIVYERDGRFLGSWGEGVFTRPHGITIHDDVVYCADDTDHTVRAFTLDGKLLWTLGTLNQPSDTGYSPEGRANLLSIKRGAGPFNRPTRLAVAPNGELYVSDGYGNARIHRFSADGKLIQSWGEPGTGAGPVQPAAQRLGAYRRARVRVRSRERSGPDLQPERRTADDLDGLDAAGRSVDRRRRAMSLSARWPGTWPRRTWTGGRSPRRGRRR